MDLHVLYLFKSLLIIYTGIVNEKNVDSIIKNVVEDVVGMESNANEGSDLDDPFYEQPEFLETLDKIERKHLETIERSQSPSFRLLSSSSSDEQTTQTQTKNDEQTTQTKTKNDEKMPVVEQVIFFLICIIKK